MINILAPAHHRRAVALADLIYEKAPADPSFGGRYSGSEIAAARAELERRRDEVGRNIAGIRAKMHADAQAFLDLTEEWIASNPPALRGGE